MAGFGEITRSDSVMAWSVNKANKAQIAKDCRCAILYRRDSAIGPSLMKLDGCRTSAQREGGQYCTDNIRPTAAECALMLGIQAIRRMLA